MTGPVRETGQQGLITTPFEAAASGEITPEPRVRRGRRAKVPPPFSLRLTEAEKARLRGLAGNKPLGAFIRDRLLGAEVAPRRSRREVIADHEKLAAVLALLAQSHLAQNLNQLAKHANMGTLNLTLDVVQELLAACAHVREMRATLIAALGVKPDVDAP